MFYVGFVNYDAIMLNAFATYYAHNYTGLKNFVWANQRVKVCFVFHIGVSLSEPHIYMISVNIVFLSVCMSVCPSVRL